MENNQMIKQTKYGWVNTENLVRNKNGTISWKKSVGKTIEFKYLNVHSVILITDWIDSYRVKISIKEYVDEYIIGTGEILYGGLGHALGLITSDFRYKIGDIVNDNMLILFTYTNERGKKVYTYRCLLDGYDGHIAECNLLAGQGCPVCAGNKILKGYNDIATVRPDIVNLLWYKSDAYIYGVCSHSKIDFKCPNCCNKINSRINDVSSNGLSCPKCGDDISYPEKFVYNFLQQLCNIYQENILLENFKTQKTLDWAKNITHQNEKLCGNKKYDFYIPLTNPIIIETHGEQHFKENSFHSHKNSKTLEEEQENDKLKMQLAINNGILSDHYIQLDCRKSNMAYIKNSIMQSTLPLLFNFTENQIDWQKCNRFATSSRVFEACELWNSGNYFIKDIANIMKLHRDTISKYLCRGKELGIVNDQPKHKKKPLTIQNYNL